MSMRSSLCCFAARVAPAFGSALAVSAIAITQTGCASAVWHPRVDSVAGEYKNTETLSQSAAELPEGKAEDVKAVVMKLPRGMEMKGDVLSVDPKHYEVLGKVTAKPAGEFFYPYREEWRRPFCYPQRVLVVATLFIWYVVPTNYPCGVSPGTVNERQDHIVEAMRRATKAMGGNMVLVGGFSGTVVVNKTSQSSAVVSEVEATEGVGWAIRIKSPYPDEAEEQGESEPVKKNAALDKPRPSVAAQ
jgi:hypothetical protein